MLSGGFRRLTRLIPVLALALFLFLFHDKGLFGHGPVTANYQVANDRVVIAEAGGQFLHGVVVGLHVHQHIMRLVDLVDGVGQLAAAPVLQAVNFAAILADRLAVALDHVGNLLGLVRMNHEYDFVMPHSLLLTGSLPIWCSKERRPLGAATGNFEAQILPACRCRHKPALTARIVAARKLPLPG